MGDIKRLARAGRLVRDVWILQLWYLMSKRAHDRLLLSKSIAERGVLVLIRYGLHAVTNVEVPDGCVGPVHHPPIRQDMKQSAFVTKLAISLVSSAINTRHGAPRLHTSQGVCTFEKYLQGWSDAAASVE